MKKFAVLTGVLFALGICFAFESNKTDYIYGTYGVSKDDPSAILLKIEPNHQFVFRDYSDPSHKLDITGTWLLKRGHLRLLASNSNKRFHNSWKIVNGGVVAKSRKGLCFYRLCKLP